ncbi:MAG: hypothetical protein PHQ52_01760 [Candidatus Omnitrophica bacterium]|nr:hypothetical protein [Candidatus Omnitrophota bacterium]
MKKNVVLLLISMFMLSVNLQTVSAQVAIVEESAVIENVEVSNMETKTAAEQSDLSVENDEPLKVETFKAGGIPISIPQPCVDLVEVGYDVREQMEIFVIPQNRLLSAYMIPSEIPRFSSGEENFVLSKSAAIQVFRQGEYQAFGESDFNELVEYEKSAAGAELSSIATDTEAEMNRRMDSLNLEQVKINTPLDLGALFSKPNAYSFGMIVKYSDNVKTWTTVIATTYIRVRDRLLFAYVTATYKDSETIAMVSKVSEEWADAIIAANQ